MVLVNAKRGRSTRAQTEPLAALAAVFALSLGLTIYAGVVTSDILDTSDRSIEEATLEQVWTDLAATGVYSSGNTTGPDDRIAPDGHVVGVFIEYTNSSGESVLVDGFVSEREQSGWDSWEEGDPEWIDFVIDPPPDATVASRPVAVEHPDVDGDIRGGTIRVVVWQ